MTDSSQAQELVRQGQAAAMVGRRGEARDILRRAVELDPKRADAWLALAGVEDDPADKIACFEMVLSLDPDQAEARLGLDMLRGHEHQPAPDHTHGADELEDVIAEASRKLDAAVGPPSPEEIPLDDEVLFCANHPTVETMLRCNRCGKPICTRCAVLTPVGYRCRECVGRQQKTFYTGGAGDYVIGGVIALVLGGVASFLVSMLGAWFFALILGPVIGIGISEAVRLAVQRRRSQHLWLVVAVGIVVSALPALLLALAALNLWTLISLGLFLVLAAGAASARLR
jgi:tetratricopeptide (TPR) repeat protein